MYLLAIIRKVRCGLACLCLLAAIRPIYADIKPVTREYWLKSTDAESVIQALNIVIRNPSGHRIMGGQGKHLVVTDVPEQQTQIAEIIPIMDQPLTQTKPQRIVMELVGRAGMYMQQNLKAAVAARRGSSTPAALPPSAIIVSGVSSYDTFKTTYSVFAEEDAQMMRTSRRIVDEPLLASAADLVLKGIFKAATGAPLALLTNGLSTFVARDGALFEGNKNRVKGFTSAISANEVIVVGPDRIPRHLKFKTTL
jgi:type II secretory pathway component GspD/PulD (secretin)